MDPHRLAELRSIELHRAVAARLRRDPDVLARARARVRAWLSEDSVHRHYARAWADALELPLDELCALLVADDEHARAMRQCTPFAGAVDPRTRWRIWRDTRAAHGDDA